MKTWASLGTAAIVLTAGGVLMTPAEAAAPPAGSLGGKSKSVTWTGSAVASNPAACVGAADPTCDHYALTLKVRANQDVSIGIVGAEGDAGTSSSTARTAQRWPAPPHRTAPSPW